MEQPWMWSLGSDSNNNKQPRRQINNSSSSHLSNIQPLLPQPSNNNNFLSSSYDDDSSWEEQAFAEDAAGSHGGCVWPPRSYSCTFCRREFRSAQALGGHMNVHRRDRARLKQSPIADPHHHPPIIQPYIGYQFTLDPSRLQIPTCSFVCSKNSPDDPPASSSPDNPRVSSSSDQKTFLPSAAEEERQHRKKRPATRGLEVDIETKEENYTRIIDSEEEAAVMRYKRRRRRSSSSELPILVLKGLPAKLREEVLEEMNKTSKTPGGCLREELDLELRLGNRPTKVKSV